LTYFLEVETFSGLALALIYLAFVTGVGDLIGLLVAVLVVLVGAFFAGD